MSTVTDVARRAGVSSATVSRVMNGHATVRPEARDKVLAAARELDFQPNRMAQGLRRGRGSTVALLVGDIEQNIYSALTKHVQDALGQIGLDLMLYNLDHSPARLRSFLEQAPSLGLRAIALATTDQLAGDDVHTLLQDLQRRGVVVLSIGQRLDHDGIPSIVHEERAASRRVVRSLVRAGLTPVAYVGRIGGSAIGTDRFGGYVDALAASNLPLRPELVCDVSFRYAAGDEAVQRLFDRGPGCRAIQAGSDEIALGVMAALHDRGIAVPNEVAVVGFGNIDWGAHVRPGLTTISVDHRASGQAIRAALQADADGQAPPPLVVIKRSLVKRQSAELGTPATTSE